MYQIAKTQPLLLQLIKDGFASFTYAGAWVELSNVII